MEVTKQKITSPLTSAVGSETQSVTNPKGFITDETKKKINLHMDDRKKQSNARNEKVADEMTAIPKSDVKYLLSKNINDQMTNMDIQQHQKVIKFKSDAQNEFSSGITTPKTCQARKKQTYRKWRMDKPIAGEQRKLAQDGAKRKFAEHLHYHKKSDRKMITSKMNQLNLNGSRMEAHTVIWPCRCGHDQPCQCGRFVIGIIFLIIAIILWKCYEWGNSNYTPTPEGYEPTSCPAWTCLVISVWHLFASIPSCCVHSGIAESQIVCPCCC